MDTRVVWMLSGAALMAVPFGLAAVTLPHTFADGEVASADEVNANFQALSAAIDAVGAPGATGTLPLQFGIADGCRSTDPAYGWVRFDTPFATEPVFIGTIDESLDNNGGVWSRVRRRHRNRTGIRCDHGRGTDQFYWMGIEPGLHTIDGKMVQAGVASGVATSDLIAFPTVFDEPPIILVFPDESVDDNGAVYARVINTPDATGFQVWVNATAQHLHWVALEAGDYDHGGWVWRAGRLDTAGDACGNATGCDQAFGRQFDVTPGVVATLHDSNNNGATWNRIIDSQDNQVTLRHSTSTTEGTYYIAYHRAL